MWWSWLALLVLLPITSQPALGALLGGRPVSPPSLIPCLIIVFLGLVPYLLAGGAVPKPALPLLAFAGTAILATALSFWLGIAPTGGTSVLQRSVRGLATLAIGLGFYFSALFLAPDEARLRSSLRAIALGGIAAMLWASLQPLQYPAVPLRDAMDSIHELLFSPRPLFRDRVTGMAVEPSWFADQLVLLYLPLWLASVLRWTSAFGSGRRFPWAELVMLVWGAAMLLLSSSRSGLAAWGLVWSLLLVVMGWRVAARAADALGHRIGRSGLRTPILKAAAGLGGATLALLVLAVVGASALLVATRLDARMARLLSPGLAVGVGASEPLWFTVANRLEYAERVIYWMAAARVFDLHPILGVGLGNSGFFLSKVVSPLGFTLVDVLGNLGHVAGAFANPKSLWFRLLAETGFVGFVLFLSWLLVVVASARELALRGRGVSGAVGLAAMMMAGALVVEGFSLDTFALPYLWLLPGLATAAWWRLKSEGDER